MAHSLSSGCTPLKHAYDNCFNAWFEGYLQPIADKAAGGQTDPLTQAQKQARYRQKAEEYEANCGDAWKSYRGCVEVSQHYNFCV
jgi:TRIAP1/MDM35 family protein